MASTHTNVPTLRLGPEVGPRNGPGREGALREPEQIRRTGKERLVILLIEDYPDARETLAALLEALGHEIDAVSSALAARNVTRRPDVIVSDLGLPDEDGCSLLLALRRRPGWSEIPAIAVTGFDAPEDLDRAASAGFERYFVKPLSIVELQRALSELNR